MVGGFPSFHDNWRYPSPPLMAHQVNEGADFHTANRKLFHTDIVLKQVFCINGMLCMLLRTFVAVPLTFISRLHPSHLE